MLFKAAWGIELVAWLVYAAELMAPKGESRDRWAGLVLRVGWLVQTVALVIRWSDGGLAHPPWVGLFESLVFFSWAVLSAQLIAEWKLASRASGVFSLTLACAALGTACFVLGAPLPQAAPVEPLAPILRNSWIWVHAPSAGLGLGLFLVSVFFAGLQLLQSGVRPARCVPVLAVLSMLALGLVFPGFAATSAAILAYAVFLTLDGLALKQEERLQRKSIQEAAQKPKKPVKGAKSKKGQRPRVAPLRSAATGVFRLAWAAHVASIVGMRAQDAPLLFVLLVFLAALDAIVFVMARMDTKKLAERLPSPEDLDRWSYQAALYAFPFVTIYLVSGSVWSYDAWGSYWSWAPQQTWVFVAWLYLALILHLERGRRSTAIASWAGIVFVFAALAARGSNGFFPSP